MKKILQFMGVLVLSSAMFFGTTVFPVKGEPNNKSEALSLLLEREIVQGFEDGELHPEWLLTRAQFAHLLHKAFPCEVEGALTNESFVDVDKEHWAYDDIAWALTMGYLKGYSDGRFAPEEEITYEQAATILCRVLGLVSCDEYPAGYLSEAMDYSLTDGINALLGEKLNRAQAAQFLINAFTARELLGRDSFDGNDPWTIGGLRSGLALSGSLRSMTKQSIEAVDDAALAPVGNQEMILPPTIPGRQGNTEEYRIDDENGFKKVSTSPLSTFSIDTDTASYSNVRRFILNGQEVVKGSVRTEEMLNYFNYTKAVPQQGVPFGVDCQVAKCPWNEEHQLAMLTVSGEELRERKPSNLVFLIDVSGSMYDYNKLPLVKQALSMLLDQLGENDRVSIVTYASGTRVALTPTKATEKKLILSVIDSLRAYGATAGADGLKLAYEQAELYKTDGNNRIILCTDGDFNVGPSSDSALRLMIEEKRDSGIYLSVLGFGMGNYKDSKMELLADYGNGHYAYIDNLREAKKVLVDEMPKTIYTIAKDVKIQVEFNPAVAVSYRLIGYENRLLGDEDFGNDQKDAGELGAGASVTVLYEIVPGDGTVSSLKYQTVEKTGSNELMTVKIRYKEPTGEESLLCEYPIASSLVESPSEDFYFAASVAEFGMLLNKSEFLGSTSCDSIIELARRGLGDDTFGLRTEFVQLVDLWRYREKTALTRFS